MSDIVEGDIVTICKTNEHLVPIFLIGKYFRVMKIWGYKHSLINIRELGLHESLKDNEYIFGYKLVEKVNNKNEHPEPLYPNGYICRIVDDRPLKTGGIDWGKGKEFEIKNNKLQWNMVDKCWTYAIYFHSDDSYRGTWNINECDLCGWSPHTADDECKLPTTGSGLVNSSEASIVEVKETVDNSLFKELDFPVLNDKD